MTFFDEDSDRDLADYLLPVPVHELATTEQYLRVLDGHPAKFAPREQVSYCNSGYVVLALIAKRISGRPFHDLVQQRVCGPAGLTDTASCAPTNCPAAQRSATWRQMAADERVTPASAWKRGRRRLLRRR